MEYDEKMQACQAHRCKTSFDTIASYMKQTPKVWRLIDPKLCEECGSTITEPEVTTEDWKRACCRASLNVEFYPPNQQAEVALVLTRNLMAVAHQWFGVACRSCGGTGERAYGSTATWRGGAGKKIVTLGVCDKCWGTGRTDKTGVDLRKLEVG